MRLVCLLATPVPPRNHMVRMRPAGLAAPILQPFVTYLQDRWQEGCTNAAQLFRELVARGYSGSLSSLAAAVRSWRAPRQPVQRVVRRFNVRRLCLRAPDRLSPAEHDALGRVLAEHPDIAAGHELLRRFRTMASRDLPALDAWVVDARASGLLPFAGFATGLGADRPAIDAALTLPWSTGPVEGHIHRLKLIKRRGYGRAKLDLPAPASSPPNPTRPQPQTLRPG